MSKQNHSIPPGHKRKRPNAQKHGVFAEPLILPGEDARKFEVLHSDLIEEWSPSGPSEQSKVFGLADAEGARFAHADLRRPRLFPTAYAPNIQPSMKRAA